MASFERADGNKTQDMDRHSVAFACYLRQKLVVQRANHRYDI